MGILLSFDRNRPVAKCRKPSPQIDPKTLALALRLRALETAGESVLWIEDLVESKERQIAR